MRVALGTAQFGLEYGLANRGGRVSFEAAKAIVHCAESAGIDVLDTAMGYGDCEQRLGEIGVDSWKIISKLSALSGDEVDPTIAVGEAVRRSLVRLRVTRLYGLLLHRPAQLLVSNGAQLYGALQQLKVDGIVEKIGVSIYDPAELDALCKDYEFDLVQAPLNIVDRRLIETGWLARLSSNGTEVHARSVFLQGLLLMQESERPAVFERWSPLWRRYHTWLSDTGQTALEACLRYALSITEVSRVIVGVDDVTQLEDIVRASQGRAQTASDGIGTDDPDLLNPSRWSALQR